MNYGFEINIDLFDKNSYKKAYDKLSDISKAIQDANDDFCKQLENKLREEMAKAGLSQSMLNSKIQVFPSEAGAYFTVGDYGCFVEFGTGIVGSSSPAPYASEYGWEYDINSHGEQGWLYPTTADDPNPTKKYNATKGIWQAWTAGQVGRQYMYKTWLWGQRSYMNIVRKHLERAMKNG